MSINKLLVKARKEAKHKNQEAVKKVLQRMTMVQLQEIVYGSPTDSRLHEILASVDGLYLLESG